MNIIEIERMQQEFMDLALNPREKVRVATLLKAIALEQKLAPASRCGQSQ